LVNHASAGVGAASTKIDKRILPLRYAGAALQILSGILSCAIEALRFYPLQPGIQYIRVVQLAIDVAAVAVQVHAGMISYGHGTSDSLLIGIGFNIAQLIFKLPEYFQMLKSWKYTDPTIMSGTGSPLLHLALGVFNVVVSFGELALAISYIIRFIQEAPPTPSSDAKTAVIICKGASLILHSLAYMASGPRTYLEYLRIGPGGLHDPVTYQAEVAFSAIIITCNILGGVGNLASVICLNLDAEKLIQYY